MNETIVVNNKEIEIKEFLSYGDTKKYFAIGTDESSYYLKNFKTPENGYILLKKAEE